MTRKPQRAQSRLNPGAWAAGRASWWLTCLALVFLGLLWKLMATEGPDAGATGTGRTQVRPAPVVPAEDSKTGGPRGQPTAAQKHPGELWLSGLVMDEQGEALDAVHVSLRPKALSEQEEPEYTTTDAQGRYQLGPLLPGLYDLFFSRERYLTHRVTSHVLSTSGTLDVVLEPALLVEGRVVDEEGHPISGARLRLQSLEPSADEEVGWDTVSEEWSDTSGRFVLDAPSAGPWRLGASHMDFLYSDTRVSAPAQDVTVVLPGGAAVEVTVVDEEGRLVEDAPCKLVPDGPWPSGWEVERWTDAQGRAVLRGVTGGRYLLMATSPLTRPFRLASQRLALGEREQRQVRLQWKAGRQLAGRVVDGQGQPVAGAEVRGVPESVLGSYQQAYKERNQSLLVWHHRRLSDEWMGKAGQPALTGEDGHFVLRHLQPTSYRLSASKPGYAMDVAAMGEAIEGEGGYLGLSVKTEHEGPVRLVLAYQGRIRGRVVRKDGQPLTTFDINGRVLKSEDGTFALEREPDGARVLSFGAPGLAPTLRRVEGEHGQDVNVGDVVLEEGRPVLVRVVEAEGGGPVHGASVHVRMEESGGRSFKGLFGHTGRDGTLLLTAMESRPWTLVVGHSEYLEAHVSLLPGQREVSVVLRTGALLQGHMRAGEHPVVHGKVRLYTLGGELVRSFQVREGWYSQQGVVPGRYVARAESPPVPEPTVFLPREVEVPTQGVVQLDFHSEPRGGVLEVEVSEEVEAVRLLPGRWQPTSVDALKVLLLYSHPGPRDWDRYPRIVFAFRSLPAGRYTVLAWRARRGRLELHRQEVELPAGAERVLRLEPQWHDLGEVGARGERMWGAP